LNLQAVTAAMPGRAAVRGTEQETGTLSAPSNDAVKVLVVEHEEELARLIEVRIRL
jgi:hypothetical protein